MCIKAFAFENMVKDQVLDKTQDEWNSLLLKNDKAYAFLP